KPPPVDGTVTITVSKDKRSASYLITPPQYGGRSITPVMLRDAVAKAGVTYGIREVVMSRQEEAPVYDSPVIFARAKEPVNGIDGRLEYHFTTELEKRPQLRPDGTVDYKELGALPNVRKGDRLVTMFPGTPGEAGTDVLGSNIPPKPGKTPRLLAGKNTIIDDTGTAMLANLDGQVIRDATGRVSVQNTYTVERDVDISTGNITFVGHVVVLGNVRSGFTIRAEGNVTVRGCVEGGSIYAAGSVVISDGFIGNEKSEIVSGGSLQCKHIHHGRVSVDGDLETDRLYHSHIRCGGSVRMIGRSTIIGGTLHARHEVDVRDAGSRMAGFETLIEAGSDPSISVRVKAIPAEEQQLTKRLNELTRVADIMTQLKERGRLDAGRREEYNRVLFTLQAMRQQHADLTSEKEGLMEQMQSLGYGNVIIHGTAYPGVHIVIGPESSRIQTMTSATKFFRTDAGIEMAPAG
ncbi:MAG: FapA family protein, partial [Oscillospiraceae bacterium]|nr:FapA family protein [Oscillospiraceae bacterium]